MEMKAAQVESASQEEWIRKIIELLELDKRSIFDRLLRRDRYEYLPVFGGILLHIKGKGVIWLPKSYIKGLLSKAGLSSAMINKVSLIFAFFIPGGSLVSLAYEFFKDRVWKEPPSELRQYLPHLTERVEYGSFTMERVGKRLKSVVRFIKREEKTGEEATLCVYFLRFMDKVSTTKESQETALGAIKHKVADRFQRVPTFRCRDEEKISRFIESLEKNDFNVVNVSQDLTGA